MITSEKVIAQRDGRVWLKREHSLGRASFDRMGSVVAINRSRPVKGQWTVWQARCSGCDNTFTWNLRRDAVKDLVQHWKKESGE